MSVLHPLYHPANIHLAFQLNWSVTLFWKHPETSCGWLSALREIVERDDVRILEHVFSEPGISRFLLSTKPAVSPPEMLRSLKGRLQYLLRSEHPKVFRQKYDVHSVGEARREVVESYVARQVEHHPMADPRVMKRLADYQIIHPGVDLSAPCFSAHGRYLYNLHLVLVHDGRYCEIQEEKLQTTRDGILRITRDRGMLISRAGILPDHIHLVLGCRWETSPLDIALCYMNNLAWLHGMKPIFSAGAYVGTAGAYDRGAIRRKQKEDGEGRKGL